MKNINNIMKLLKDFDIDKMKQQQEKEKKLLYELLENINFKLNKLTDNFNRLIEILQKTEKD